MNNTHVLPENIMAARLFKNLLGKGYDIAGALEFRTTDKGTTVLDITMQKGFGTIRVRGLEHQDWPEDAKKQWRSSPD